MTMPARAGSCWRSPSSRRAWIEISGTPFCKETVPASPSSRRAWIEILRAGRVGRRCLVALLAEGVDRNLLSEYEVFATHVALLAEGVDRNLIQQGVQPDGLASPSSRRAWIEISASILHGTHAAVALLAEGVDRNLLCFTDRLPQLHVALLAEGVDRNWLTAFGAALLIWSPSSRRAWIEIDPASSPR